MSGVSDYILKVLQCSAGDVLYLPSGEPGGGCNCVYMEEVDYQFLLFTTVVLFKVDGVGPVDNRPSTD